MRLPLTGWDDRGDRGADVTLGEFLALARQRWWILLAGAVTTGLVVGLVLQQPSTYWSKVTVMVLRPASFGAPNVLQDQASATAAAGALVVRFTRSTDEVRDASPTAPLYGEGVREGERVQVRSVGGQWTYHSPNPNIDIEVVSSSPVRVEQRIQTIISSLADDLDAWQTELGVAPRMRLRLEKAPGLLGVIQVTGSPLRGLVATLLVGVAVSALAVAASARVGSRRARRGRHA